MKLVESGNIGNELYYRIINDSKCSSALPNDLLNSRQIQKDKEN